MEGATADRMQDGTTCMISLSVGSLHAPSLPLGVPDAPPPPPTRTPTPEIQVDATHVAPEAPAQSTPPGDDLFILCPPDSHGSNWETGVCRAHRDANVPGTSRTRTAFLRLLGPCSSAPAAESQHRAPPA